VVAIVVEVVMSNLLQVSQIPTRGKVPLMLEIQVVPETAPYLVSSTTEVVWIPESMAATPELWPRGVPDHIVRVAVREGGQRGYGPFFLEVLEAVRDRGVKSEWGNVHPLTEEGIQKAVDHIGFYELGETCLLIPFKADEKVTLPLRDIAADLGCLPQPTRWLPGNCVVAVPKNREYLGMVGILGRKGFVVVVHNAARAMGIAWGDGT